MRPFARFVIAAAIVLAAALPGYAQDSIRWQTTLENAKRIAAQNNQLILVHFWAPWCGACRRMEQEVFTDPTVGAALGMAYVPCKLNADSFPTTAKQYGITMLPTDVIITADGQLVQKMQGFTKAPDYASQLNQIAMTRVRQAAPAQVAAVAPQAGAMPGVPMVDPRYGLPQAQPGAVAAVPPYAVPANVPGPQPNAYAAVPPATVAAPSAAYGAAMPGMTPPAYSNQAAGVAASIPAPTQGMPAAAMAGYPAMPGAMPQNAPAGVGIPATGMAAGAVTSVPGGMPMAAPAAGGMTPAPGMASGPANPAAGAASPAAQANANSALGLDGYCPVRLGEKQTWALGDRRYGAVHRGRTYLFVGAEEQAKFLANPDAYAPMMSGYDVVLAMEQGQTVAGKRQHGVFFGTKVFLFSSEETLQRFSQNPEQYMSGALQAMRPTSYTAR